jgi:hypothetical protein
VNSAKHQALGSNLADPDWMEFQAVAANVGTTDDSESVDSLHFDGTEVDSVDPASWVTEYIRRLGSGQDSRDNPQNMSTASEVSYWYAKCYGRYSYSC